MTKDEINRAMADKVMGWKFEHGYPGDFYSRDGTIVFWVNDWNPSECIGHAMMCLEKFPIWKITKFPDSNYECVIGVGKGYRGGAIDTELARTIYLAILEAVKEREIMQFWKLHKLCPAWRYHVIRTFKFQVFREHWFCRYCPLMSLMSCGRAYRQTIGRGE